MEEKDSAISGPCEESQICLCGQIRSGFVEWYRFDLSVEKACLSEKTGSRTKELSSFSVANHLPSYAALGGRIYSLGGLRRSDCGGDILLNDVWSKSFKSLVLRTLKPGSTPPLTSPTVKDWKSEVPMTFARCQPHTVVVDNKLYVLGGFPPNQNQPSNGWIEVVHPEEEKWESLPSPPDQIPTSLMISGLLKSKNEIIIAKQRWDCPPSLFYSYNITTRCWKTLVVPASVHSNIILPPNIGRAVSVGNTLYWVSAEERSDAFFIRAYDLDWNMWFEDHLNTATIFGRREYFTSIYSRGPGFLHLVDQKFCLLLQSTVPKKDPQSTIEYLYCVILDISPIYDHKDEDWGKFELTTVSVQKYSMDHYIDFLDCMLLHRERSTTQPPQFPGGLFHDLMCAFIKKMMVSIEGVNGSDCSLRFLT